MRAMQIAQDGMSFAAGLVTIMLGLHGRRSMTGPSTAEVEESSRQAGDQKETKGMKMEGAEELSPKARSDPYRDMIAKGEIVAGRWNLVKKLGEGGFGVVWEAQSVEKRGRKRAGKAAWNCGGKVAIKVCFLPLLPPNFTTLTGNGVPKVQSQGARGCGDIGLSIAVCISDSHPATILCS